MTSWLALDIGGTKIRQAVVSEDGELRGEHTYSTTELPEPGSTRDRVLAAWEPVTASRARGIGISVAAMVDEGGTVLAAPNLRAWQGVNLVELFAAGAGCPVHVVFDGTAALLGECWVRNADLGNAALGNAGLRHAFVLSIGTGIGGGLMVDGTVLRGAHGLSGMPTSALVRRGGGLESIASGPAVAAAAGAGSGIEAARRCRAGQVKAVSAFRAASAALYEVVAGVTATVDVDQTIVAGGFGVGAFELLFPETQLPSEFVSYPLVHRDVRISVAVTGANAALLGAARYAALRERETR